MADRHDIDEVRSRVDIVSVVEQYVTLKRSGSRLKGLCPFHQEKTPSFHVNPDLGMWHCFGSCAEGGDVFKFIQKIENLSFPEALERLALRAGVTLTPKTGRAASVDSGSAAAPSEAGERDRLYRINALALGFYRDMLGRSSEARDYLQGRGLAHAIQDAFHIGFAPDIWDGLTTFLTRKGVPLADAEKAGLVSKNERGYFDKLRGRLIFPILDVQERPIAFGGRLIAEARPGQPKYWNSPETPVFSKSRTLYGLWRARKAIAAQGQAVVVEGYTDVVAAHQAGFENVVATLGTSLTEEHVRILARLAPTVLLGFDADSAGLKAAFRAAEIFEAQEVEVRVLDLPDGDDPDSLLRAGKRRVFEQAMTNALPLVEYRLKRLVQKEPTETERDRVALFRKALPILASVPSMIEREQYVKLLAPYHPQFQSGAVYAEEQIRQDVSACSSGATGRTPESRFQPTAPRPAAPVVRPVSATERAERHLLRALTGDDAALADLVLTQITPSEFLNVQARALAAAIYAHFESASVLEPSLLLARLEDETLRGALSALMMEQAPEPPTPALIEGAIAHLKLRAREERRSALATLMKLGQATPEDREEYRRITNELRGSHSPQLAGVN